MKSHQWNKIVLLPKPKSGSSSQGGVTAEIQNSCFWTLGEK